jgi:hypothetical protein
MDLAKAIQIGKFPREATKKSQSYPNWEVSQRSHQKIPKLSRLGKFFQANQSFWENPKYGNL